MLKVGSPSPRPIPDTSGMTDEEFCQTLGECHGAEPEDVARTRDQIIECLRQSGKDPSDWRRIMLAMA